MLLRAPARLRSASLLAARSRSLLVAHARPCLVAARGLSTAAEQPAEPAKLVGSVMDELERLENLPWYKSGILRLVGTFSDTQKQAAAGCDMFVRCYDQAQLPQFYADEGAGLEDRYYRRFQVKGLLCWLCHVRLRQEPKESFEHLFHEIMEKVWDKVNLDLSDQGMDFVHASSHLKDMQLRWHGFARMMDEALAAAHPREEIVGVLRRNMYADEDGGVTPEGDAAAQRLADYVQAQIAHLAAIPTESVLKGRITWGRMELAPMEPRAAAAPAADA